MSEQDKLRHRLQEHYDNQPAAYSDDEWERASAYLNAARRARRIRYSVFALTILLSAIFMTIHYLPTTAGDKKQLTSAPSDQRLRSAPTVQSTMLHASTALPPHKLQGHSIFDKSARPSEPALPSSPKARKKTSEVQVDLSDARTSQVFESNNTVAPEADVDGQENGLLKKRMSDNTHEVAPISIADSTVNENKSKDESMLEMPQDFTKNAGTVPLRAENLTQQQNQFEIKELPQVPMEALIRTTETPALTIHKKEIAINDSTTRIVSQEVMLPVMTNTSHIVATDSIVVNTQALAAEDTVPEFPDFDRLSGEGIFYEAGAAGLYGWKGPEHRDAQGFSPVAGVHYMNRLTHRCALSFGLQYLQINHLSNSSKTSRVSSYKYGEQSRVTVITPSAVHYLVAPLRFHYSVSPKNSFGAGINLAYLLNVDATVTSYDEKPGSSENYKTVKLSGYTEGFSWFDSQLAFLYRRRIGSSFGLQAELFLGLTDVKQDEFFGSNYKERNSGAKLSLIYYAFRKNSR